jgi:hypothetical protein
MPHDKHGTLLTIGDEVTIRAVVRDIYIGATTCNLSVVTVEKMLPEHETGSTITLNANQVEKLPAPA